MLMVNRSTGAEMSRVERRRDGGQRRTGNRCTKGGPSARVPLAAGTAALCQEHFDKLPAIIPLCLSDEL